MKLQAKDAGLLSTVAYTAGSLLAALIFIASLASVELGLSAAIIEITLGVVGGNVLGIQQLEWVRYMAGFGGILLTFMAGAEVDLKVLRQEVGASLSIGGLSFFAPFLGTLLSCRSLLGWDLKAAQLAGIALVRPLSPWSMRSLWKQG